MVLPRAIQIWSNQSDLDFPKNLQAQSLVSTANPQRPSRNLALHKRSPALRHTFPLMHQALLIDEILRHIFSFISEDGLGPLGALARSCRAWTDPALDLVWIKLSSAVPLLQVIPGVRLVDGTYVRNGFSFVSRVKAN